ncbi:MAG TPA: ABC transporter permease [Erysipelotrichaceae bacterium]|nr:ABC transporter permease [Erysipelotrichaceae bacterium]
MFKEYFSIAWRSVVAHKIRALLTTLGVVIGVSSVILLLSLGNSAKAEAANQIRAIGSNLIIVRVTDRNGVLPTIWLDELKDSGKLAAYSEIISGNTSYVVNGQNFDVSVSGVNQDYGFVSSLELTKGRFLSQIDIDNNLPVVVIGPKVAEKLFPLKDAIGETMVIQGVQFRVIGILTERGTNFNGDLDATAYIPIDFAGTLYPYRLNSKTYYLASETEDTVATSMRKIESYLTSVLPSANEFNVFSQSQILGVMNTLMGLLTTLLAGIASISLIVGGIGIMNIMLVTVRERTREIGVRKALGAKRSQILIQFLIEAVIITTLGGLIGLGVSYVGAAIIQYLSDFKVTVGLDSVFLSLIFSITIGVVFGIYPANKASQLEPVDALRYE